MSVQKGSLVWKQPEQPTPFNLKRYYSRVIPNNTFCYVSTRGNLWYFTTVRTINANNLRQIIEDYITANDSYLTGISGSGNGTVTFTRSEALVALTWDAAYNHNQLYNTTDTRSTPNVLPSDYNNILKISGYKDAAAVGKDGSLMGVNGYVDLLVVY